MMTSPIPRFLQSLRPPRRPRQLPRRSPLHLPEGVRAGEGRGELQCLARALCRFRWVPYDAVPAAERRAYVRLQLLAWSPFEDNGYAVVGGRDGAMAFAWDQRAFEQRAQAAGLPTQPARTLPETCCCPRTTTAWCCRPAVPGSKASSGAAGSWWPAAGGPKRRMPPHG